MLGLPPEFTVQFLARLEHIRIKTRREYSGMGKGAHLSPKRGSSLEFSDYRHYVAGDDFRYIDWGLYGRTDKLYIRLFKEEEDLLTYIILDASASMGYPKADHKFESAKSLALALAYVALSGGDRVMLRVLEGGAERGQQSFLLGRHRVVDLAKYLATIKPQGRVDLATGMARELVEVKRAGKVFVISDYQMQINSITRGLELFMAANMDVTAVQVLGARELTGQGTEGDVEVVDAETGERVRVAMGDRARNRYREAMIRQAREVRSFCLKRGMHYTLYTTDLGFEQFFVRAVTELGLVH